MSNSIAQEIRQEIKNICNNFYHTLQNEEYFLQKNGVGSIIECANKISETFKNNFFSTTEKAEFTVLRIMLRWNGLYDISNDMSNVNSFIWLLTQNRGGRDDSEANAIRNQLITAFSILGREMVFATCRQRLKCPNLCRFIALAALALAVGTKDAKDFIKAAYSNASFKCGIKSPATKKGKTISVSRGAYRQYQPFSIGAGQADRIIGCLSKIWDALPLAPLILFSKALHLSPNEKNVRMTLWVANERYKREVAESGPSDLSKHKVFQYVVEEYIGDKVALRDEIKKSCHRYLPLLARLSEMLDTLEKRGCNITSFREGLRHLEKDVFRCEECLSKQRCIGRPSGFSSTTLSSLEKLNNPKCRQFWGEAHRDSYDNLLQACEIKQQDEGLLALLLLAGVPLYTGNRKAGNLGVRHAMVKLLDAVLQPHKWPEERRADVHLLRTVFVMTSGMLDMLRFSQDKEAERMSGQ